MEISPLAGKPAPLKFVGPSMAGLHSFDGID
jgi:hypothetical protein